MSAPGETTDDGGEIACPHGCGATWGDLWDYAWGSSEGIDIECPSCDRPVRLVRVVTVDYVAKTRT